MKTCNACSEETNLPKHDEMFYVVDNLCHKCYRVLRKIIVQTLKKLKLRESDEK
jgi:hypothetical protein